MLIAVSLFLVVVNATWVPVWVANEEAGHSDDLRIAVHGFADLVDEHATRGQLDRLFGRALPVGKEGLPVIGTGGVSGRVMVVDAPRLTVLLDGAPVEIDGEDAASRGALVALTNPTRYPTQAFRYVGGAVELAQGEGAWVDLRTLVVAERTGDGRVSVALQPVHIASAPQDVSANRNVRALGKVTGVGTADVPPYIAGEDRVLRVVVENVEADAWRSAVNRTLSRAGLAVGADCAAAGVQVCFPPGAANTDTTATFEFPLAGDVTVRRTTLVVNVQP